MIRRLTEHEEKCIQKVLDGAGYHLEGGSYEETEHGEKFFLTVNFGTAKTYGAKFSESLLNLLGDEIWVNGLRLKKPPVFYL